MLLEMGRSTIVMGKPTIMGIKCGHPKKQMVLRHLVSGYASDLLEDPMKNGDETQTHSFMFGYSIWKHIGY